MTIIIDMDTGYHYEEQIHTLRMLKRAHDFGIDVNIAKDYYNLNSYYSYSNQLTLFDLFKLLVKAAFPSLTFLESYSTDTLFLLNIHDQKNELLKNFIIPEELQLMFNNNIECDYSQYVFLYHQADFSQIDFKKAHEDAFPFIQRPELMMEPHRTHYLKYQTKQTPHCIKLDSGLEAFYFWNESKNEFLFVYNEEDITNEIDPLLAFLYSIYKQLPTRKD